MRRQVLTAVTAFAVVVGSCGAAPLEDAGNERVGDTAGSASTAAPAATAPLAVEIGCPNFLADGEDRSKRRSYDGNKLDNDAQRLSEYLAAHEDVFGGLRIAHNPTRLEIGFTAEIDEHCYVLRELAKRPNGIDVIRVEYSIADKLAAAEVAAQAGASTSAPGLRPLGVRLPAFADGIAAELDAAYGDMLKIEVGGWPYPPPGDVPGLEACEPVAESEELPPLRVTMTAPADPLNYLVEGKATVMGSYVIAGEATLVIENRGTETGTLFWGQQVSSLFAGQDDSRPVSFYTGAIELWGRYAELKPGDTIAMTAFIGLTPCSLDGGYMLSPGTYQLRGPFEFEWNDEHYVILADPVSVTVEETPPTSLAPKRPTTNTAPPTTQGT